MCRGIVDTEDRAFAILIVCSAIGGMTQSPMTELFDELLMLCDSVDEYDMKSLLLNSTASLMASLGDPRSIATFERALTYANGLIINSEDVWLTETGFLLHQIAITLIGVDDDRALRIFDDALGRVEDMEDDFALIRALGLVDLARSVSRSGRDTVAIIDRLVKTVRIVTDSYTKRSLLVQLAILSAQFSLDQSNAFLVEALAIPRPKQESGVRPQLAQFLKQKQLEHVVRFAQQSEFDLAATLAASILDWDWRDAVLAELAISAGQIRDYVRANDIVAMINDEDPSNDQKGD